MQIREDLPKFNSKPIDLSSWRLRVDGLVRQRLNLTFDDLGGLPKVSLTEDFRCLEGWIVRDITWQGVRVSSILKLSELKPEAKGIMFSSGDYSTVLQTGKALEDTTILASAKSGKILDDYHGGPVRLVFQGHECYESVKSVDRIMALESYEEGTARNIALARLPDQRLEVLEGSRQPLR
jgi:DMSO/TMAO reductase YedYZ molybdopterin-dependent catalytic subunit